MSNQGHDRAKLGPIAIVLMIFTSVFGFINISRAFWLMSYAAIFWYVLAAILFFVPFAFMVAEYGSAFKSEKGGIYSWMAKSIGPRYAFVGAFMWFVSFITWQVNTSGFIWIPASIIATGHDSTREWAFGPLYYSQIIGILAILWIIIVTLVSSRGLKWISKATGIGGIAVMALNVLLVLGAVVVLIKNGARFAQPASGLRSPNPGYQNPLALVSFLVFALFAYGGTECTGGLVDKTRNPEKNFPRAIGMAAVCVAVGYSLGVFCIGMFANWQVTFDGDTVNFGNVVYIVMDRLGQELAKAFGAEAAATIVAGHIFARVTAFFMLLAYIGAFFTLLYAPLKQLIEGTPAKLWPKGFTKDNKHGVPFRAMLIQALVVIIIIALVAFGGTGAKAFYQKLVLMSNVSMTIPYFFISFAYYSFKTKKSIHRPFEIIKSRNLALCITIVVSLLIVVANVATIADPIINGATFERKSDAFWMIGGPLVFAVVALLLYGRYARITRRESGETR